MNDQRHTSDDSDPQQVILTIAREEFGTNGYAAASTDSIIQKANIARGSLYYYFRNKQDLFRKIYISYLNELQNDLTKRYDGLDCGKKQLSEAFACFMDKAENDSYFTRIALLDAQTVLPYPERMSLISDSGLYANIQKPLLLSQRKGELPPDVDIEALSISLFGMIVESGRLFSPDENDPTLKPRLCKNFDWVLSRLITL